MPDWVTVFVSMRRYGSGDGESMLQAQEKAAKETMEARAKEFKRAQKEALSKGGKPGGELPEYCELVIDSIVTSMKRGFTACSHHGVTVNI